MSLIVYVTRAFFLGLLRIRIVIFHNVYRYTLQGEETIEMKIRQYEHALDSAAGIYREIQQLVTNRSNDYNLNVMTRLTTATITLKIR